MTSEDLTGMVWQMNERDRALYYLDLIVYGTGVIEVDRNNENPKRKDPLNVVVKIEEKDEA